MGMRVMLKDEACQVTDVREMKAKGAKAVKKTKLTALNAAGKSLKLVKPCTHTLQRVVGEQQQHDDDAQGPEINEEEEKGASSSEENDEYELEDYDCTITESSADAALTTPVRCGSLKKGDFVVLKGNKPCKIVAMTVVQVGKHGHTKATITGLDVFTGKKYIEAGVPSDHTVAAPVMQRKDWQLTDLSYNGGMTLMDEGGSLREDLDLPTDTQNERNELGEHIATAFEELGDGSSRALFLTVLSAMGAEQVIDCTVKQAF